MPWPRCPDKRVIKTWYNNTTEPHWVVKKNKTGRKMNPRKCYIKQGDPDSERQKSHQFFSCRPYFFMNVYKCMWVQVRARKLGRRPWEGKEASRRRAGRRLVHAPCALPLKQQRREQRPENWTRSWIHVASLASGVSQASVFSFPLHGFSSGFVV